MKAPPDRLVRGHFSDRREASLEEEHQGRIQYGIMLLKILSDFRVTFVRECGDTIYESQAAPRGFMYFIYYYQNGDTIVLMHGYLSKKHRRHKASGNGILPVVRELRWRHVTGEISGEDYDGVLDGIIGECGTLAHAENGNRSSRTNTSAGIWKASAYKRSLSAPA